MLPGCDLNPEPLASIANVFPIMLCCINVSNALAIEIRGSGFES